MKKHRRGLRLAACLLALSEDNALNMEVMEFLLSDVGIKVTKAADGQQAVEAFAASPVGGFDAILMDVMMPVRDDHEAPAPSVP